MSKSDLSQYPRARQIEGTEPTMTDLNRKPASSTMNLKDTATMINVTANVNEQQNKRSRTDDASSVLAVISSELVQFLGVRSLLSFGATCKSHRDVVAGEIVRRKAYIMEIAVEINRLLVNQTIRPTAELTESINRIAHENGNYNQQQVEGDDNEEMKIIRIPTYAKVSSAKKMLYNGMKLIDEFYISRNKRHVPCYHFYRQYIFREELIALWSIDQFIKDIERTVDYSLSGPNAFPWRTWKEYIKEVESLKIDFSLPLTPPRQLYFLSGVKILLDDIIGRKDRI
jgi:hypothetical protein